MLNRIITTLIVVLSMFSTAYADNYRVRRVFGKGDITIAGKAVTRNMVFSDDALIKCTAEKTGMEVVNVSKREQGVSDYVVFSTVITHGAEMSMKAYRSLMHDYEEKKQSEFFPRRSLHSKSFTNTDQSVFLLSDTLTIGGLGAFLPYTKIEAVWNDGGTEHRTEQKIEQSVSLYRSTNIIYFTPSIFCGKEPRFTEIRIEATDELGGPYLVRKIWIDPIY